MPVTGISGAALKRKVEIVLVRCFEVRDLFIVWDEVRRGEGESMGVGWVLTFLLFKCMVVFCAFQRRRAERRRYLERVGHETGYDECCELMKAKVQMKD